MRLGVVVGLAAEARIARRLGCPVGVGGGTLSGAEAAAERLVASGVDALLSFGLAGGLDPALRPGALVVPLAVRTGGRRIAADPALSARLGGVEVPLLLGAAHAVASAADKRLQFRQTRAVAVDLESGAVARVAAAHGLPFAVLRAICDPAERSLPPAAVLALDATGRIALPAVLRSLAGNPLQIGALVGLARQAGRARRALVRRVGDLGGTLAGL